MSDIQYRNLGRNGVKVSPITLGTMMFGGQTPDDVARRITDRAFEQGINAIDTAYPVISGLFSFAKLACIPLNRNSSDEYMWPLNCTPFSLTANCRGLRNRRTACSTEITRA